MARKISVCMICYNQAKYIAQAIDSVLAQDGPFRVELVVGDDCSTDGTTDIVVRYARKFPDAIRVLPTPSNLGLSKNFRRTFEQCDGDFIALLEGDDYWLTRHKLAKQLEFLDTHPECVGCGHGIKRVDEADCVLSEECASSVELRTFRRIAFANPFATCSLVYRKTLDSLPAWMDAVPCGDWPLHLLHARHGPIGLVPDILGAYRIHPQAAWSPMSAIEKIQKTLTMFEYVLAEFNGDDRTAVEASRFCHGLDLAYALAETGRRAEARDRFQRAVRQNRTASRLPLGKILIVGLGVYLAPIYWPLRNAFVSKS